MDARANETGWTQGHYLEWLEGQGVSLEMDWSLVLADVPARLQTVLEERGVRTLGELAACLDAGAFTEISRVGKATRARVLDELRQLGEHGVDQHRFGMQRQPADVEELVTCMLARLDPRARTWVDRHYLQCEDYRSIGESADVTHQRVHQVVERSVARLGPLFRDVLDVVVGGEVQALHNGGLSYGAGPPRLRWLAAAAAGTAAELWLDVLLTTLPGVERNDFLAALRRTFDTQPSPYVSRDAACSAVRALVDLDEDGVTALLRRGLEMTLVQDRFAMPWRSQGDFLAALLAEAGESLATQEIHARYDALREHLPFLAPLATHAMRAHLQRHPDVFTPQRGFYAHRSTLELDPVKVEEVVTWCVARLNEVGERMMAGELLDGYESEHGAAGGLTRYLLRDALSRHPDVVAFKGRDHVAHVSAEN